MLASLNVPKVTSDTKYEAAIVGIVGLDVGCCVGLSVGREVGLVVGDLNRKKTCHLCLNSKNKGHTMWDCLLLHRSHI